MNVDGPAIVTWIPEQKIGLTFASGGEKRPFDSLRGAVKFVIEKLSSVEAIHAVIVSGSDRLDLTRIQQIYESNEFDKTS